MQTFYERMGLNVEARYVICSFKKDVVFPHKIHMHDFLSSNYCKTEDPDLHAKNRQNVVFTY